MACDNAFLNQEAPFCVLWFSFVFFRSVTPGSQDARLDGMLRSRQGRARRKRGPGRRQSVQGLLQRTKKAPTRLRSDAVRMEHRRRARRGLARSVDPSRRDLRGAAFCFFLSILFCCLFCCAFFWQALTRDHTPRLPGEAERIVRAGGFTRENRVDGQVQQNGARTKHNAATLSSWPCRAPWSCCVFPHKK